MSLEALNLFLREHFDIEGSVYLVNQDLDRDIIEFHAFSGDLPFVNEAENILSMPLDKTIKERLRLLSEEKRS